MKKKILSITVVILLIFVMIFALNCKSQKNSLSVMNKTPQPVQNLNGEGISRLDNGVIVRFSATVVKQSGSNCIEVFAQDDFKKYNGDGKFAIFSRFAFEPRSIDSFEGSKNAIVTGRMTAIRDSADTNKTCGIYTGQLFEITEIEYF